jgi:hypothetical protein
MNIIKESILLIKGNRPGTICRANDFSRAGGIDGVIMGIFFIFFIFACPAAN